MKLVSLLTAVSLALVLLLGFVNTNAQALTTDSIKAQMIKDWQRGKEYTLEYLNTMPADKYNFKAADSIRSFAQQMLHLAQGNLFLM